MVDWDPVTSVMYDGYTEYYISKLMDNFYLLFSSSHECFDPWGVECLLFLF